MTSLAQQDKAAGSAPAWPGASSPASSGARPPRRSRPRAKADGSFLGPDHLRAFRTVVSRSRERFFICELTVMSTFITIARHTK